MLRLCTLCAVFVLVSGLAADAQRDPPLPPGRDPGGVAIALLGTGIDYTVPDIARRLARDGEGELIGWDLVDNDNRPFRSGRAAPDAGAWDASATALGLAMGAPGRRIVPVRIDPGDARSLARAVAFLAQTPARIVVVPAWSRRQGDWEPFRDAATHFKDLLFVVPAGDDATGADREPAWPAAFRLANALVVAASPADGGTPGPAGEGGMQTADALVALPRTETVGDPPPPRASLAAAVAADALAGCWPRLIEIHRGEPLKRALLAEAAKAAARGGRPLIVRCAADATRTKR
jgi:hypothetical protein